MVDAYDGDYYDYEKLCEDIKLMSRQLENAIGQRQPQQTINAYVAQLRNYLTDYLRRTRQ